MIGINVVSRRSSRKRSRAATPGERSCARGFALGLAAPAIGVVLSRVSAASVAAQEGPVKVSIVNKEMTHDEIAEAVKAEGTVNVGNWTYTANDTLVAKFQEYVKNTYGADITLNYQASQQPSTYLTALYTALAERQSFAAGRDGHRGNLLAGGAVATGTGDAGVSPVRSHSKRGPCARRVEARADRDRLPSLCHSGDRLRQTACRLPGGLDRPRGRTPKREGDRAALRGHHCWWVLDGPCGGSWSRLQEARRHDEDDRLPRPKDSPERSAVHQRQRHNAAAPTAGVADATVFWNSLGRLEFLDGQTNTTFLVAKSAQY